MMGLLDLLQANMEKGMQLQERAALIADLQRQLAARPGQEAMSQLSAAQVLYVADLVVNAHKFMQHC